MIQAEKTNRILSISNLRIVGILLVVFGHSYPFNVQIPSFLLSLRTFIYIFHMPLFIFISAYLVMKTQSIKRKGTKEYIKGRAMRMLIPYICLSLLFFVPKLFAQSLISDGVELSLSYVIEAIFVPRNNIWGHFWFLPVIFFLAVCSVFYEKLLYEKRAIGKVICIMSFLLLFIPKITDWFALNDIKNNICWYLLGMLAGSCDKPLVNTPLARKVFVILSFLIITVATIIFYNVTNYFLLISLKIIITALVIAALFELCSNVDFLEVTFLKEIERNSFSIFILSWPYQAVVEIITNKLLSAPFVVCMMAMFIVGMIAPIITIKIILLFEKKTSNKFLNNFIKAIKLLIGV